MIEAPEMQGQMVSSHGLLAILEVLESKPARDVILKLLQIVNLVCQNDLFDGLRKSNYFEQLVTSDLGILESFCLIG